jgi:pilus assembly protein CpaE
MEIEPVSILVVDGDSASRNFLSAALKNTGYQVLLASLGREGLISAWRDHPNIIILDPALPDMTGLELVTRLRQDHRTSKVLLVALSSREDPQEMNTLLKAGCSEYLVKSSQTLQKLMELLPRLGNKEESAPARQGRLIVFLSSKGGTGTSSLCANIAMCVASQAKARKVAVMDLVLPIGSIANIVGYKDNLNLVSAALQPPDQITPAYFQDNLPLIPKWYFYLLAGAPDPESANRLSIDRVGEILKAILDTYDFVFVDLGRSLSRISLPIIQKAEIIVLILSSDLATADLTLSVRDYLKSQGVDLKRIFLIQNRAAGLEGLTKMELEKMLGMSIGVTIPYVGDNFTVANNRHEPVPTRFQNSSISLTLIQAAKEMLVTDKHSNRL